MSAYLVLCARVGAAVHADLDPPRPAPGRRLSCCPASQRARPLRFSLIGELAESLEFRCTPSRPCRTGAGMSRGGPARQEDGWGQLGSPHLGSTSTITNFSTSRRADLAGAISIGQVGHRRSWWPLSRAARGAKPTKRGRRAADARRRGRARHRCGRRRGPVGERLREELLLQDPPELLGTPILDQELEPGMVARAAVAVLAVETRDPCPVSAARPADEGLEPLREHRVRSKDRSDPQVEAGSELRVSTPTSEMSLISGSVQRATQPLIDGLVLPREVREFRRPDEPMADLSIIGVASRISSAAMPARGHPRITVACPRTPRRS